MWLTNAEKVNLWTEIEDGVFVYIDQEDKQ